VKTTAPARSLLALCALTATISVAPDALAIRPDLDGERGIEAQVGFGVAGVANSHPRFLSMVGPGAPGPSATSLLGPGFNFRAALGYRFAPMLSAGLSFSIAPLGAYELPNASTSTYQYGASTFSVGAYARLYYLALVSSIPRTARVEFLSWGDLRRLDPWVSLGVEYQSISYTQTNRAMPAIGAAFSRGAIAVPVGIGFEYRLIPMLAVGLATHLSPTFGSWSTKQSTNVVGGNIQTVNESYSADDPVNFVWSAGLTARYTLSL
jgi:hypothetical protein